MSFDVPNIHKWSDNIEHTLTEWSEHHVKEWYDVDDSTELSAAQIEEIEEFLAEAEDTWYNWVCIGFRNIVNNWENEHYDD